MTELEARTRLSQATVREVCNDIQAYWGAHLYVRVVPEVTPCMDWREVLIPPDFSDWSVDRLTATLVHEWGHRMISPVSPLVMAIWRKIAQRTGLGENQATLAANLVADAWVDRANFENPRWRMAYLSGHSETISKVEGQLDALEPDSKAAPMIPFIRILAVFNRRLCREFGSPDIDPHTDISYSERELAAVDELWNIVYDELLTEEERVKRVSEWLKNWLPEEERVYLPFYPRFHPATARVKNGGELTDRIRMRGIRGGLSDSDLAEIFGRDTLDELKLRTARLKMYASIVPAVERFLSYRRRMAFEGYKPWRPGGRLADLDVVATIERSSMIIPGVTTLARNFNRRGFHASKGSGCVILVIDDSGSTDGDVLRREKEAAFAVIAAARRFGDPVGMVVFGGEVTASLPPTSRYDLLEEQLCRLDSYSGGTVMEPALREALSLTNGYKGFTVMIMTDAEVADLEGLRSFVLSYPLDSNLVAFCFNTPDAVRENLGLMASRIRLLSASPDLPFVEAALEEIYG